MLTEEPLPATGPLVPPETELKRRKIGNGNIEG
jgi:hypothetical protein